MRTPSPILLLAAAASFLSVLAGYRWSIVPLFVVGVPCFVIAVTIGIVTVGYRVIRLIASSKR